MSARTGTDRTGARRTGTDEDGTGLRVTVVDHMCLLELDRPEALNALSPDLLGGLERALDQVEADDDIRVVVLTGTGRAFCAGADLRSVGALAPDDDADGAPGDALVGFLRRVQGVVVRLRRLRCPVVAALNGITMGGGLELALAADVVVATQSATIADAHARVGVLPGAGGATVLPRRVPAAVANYLLFTGDRLTAAEMAAAGLVARVYPDDTFEADVRALAGRIADTSPLAAARLKRLVAAGLRVPDELDALPLELAANAEHATSQDMAEGVAAFAERRRPRWTGR